MEMLNLCNEMVEVWYRGMHTQHGVFAAFTLCSLSQKSVQVLALNT